MHAFQNIPLPDQNQLQIGRPVPPSPTFSDIVYKRLEGFPLALDVYLPPSPQKTPENGWPVIVWFHGGGWHQGARGFPYLHVLLQYGFAIVDADYRLTDKGTVQDILADCYSVLNWIMEEHASFNLNANAISVAGSSAGGHLALLVASGVDRPEDSPKIKAVAAFCPPTDLACSDAIHAHPRRDDYHWMLEKLLGGPLEAHMELAIKYSPASYVNGNMPPAFLLHGNNDSVIDVEQSRVYTQLMRMSGADIVYEEVEGGEHSADSWNWKEITASVHHFFLTRLLLLHEG